MTSQPSYVPSNPSSLPNPYPLTTNSNGHVATDGSANNISGSVIPNNVNSNKRAKGPGGTSSSAALASSSLIWQWEISVLERWIRSLSLIFPRRPGSQQQQLQQQQGVNEGPVSDILKPKPLTEEQYWKRTTSSNTYTQNLLTALTSSCTHNEGNRDIFAILDSSFSRGKEITHLPGAILSRLTLGGLLNGSAGIVGGVISDPSISFKDNCHPSITCDVLFFIRTLRNAIRAKLEMDMMESTPLRIVDILCPEVSLAEVNAIRKRIYDTVVLGRGTGSSSLAQSLEGEDLPIAAKVGVHDIDKWKKCKSCGNNDQAEFDLDRKNGDVICTNCGTVCVSSIMHEGSQFRKFEGEADRNHHGDIANPLYSNAHNMSTTLGGLSSMNQITVMGGNKRSMETVLRNAHAYTEMNISQFGKEEKKTRVGYKDRQKKDAFVKMTHVGDALSLHEAVVQRAKELFAGFRDDRELVQQFKGVVAGCLCEAYHQLCKDGRQILKRVAGEDDDINESAVLSARTNWRNDMHKSTMAGKVLTDNGTGTPNTTTTDTTAKVMTAATVTKVKEEPKINVNITSILELKQASLWTLDECRNWLLEASKSIAREWHESPQYNKTNKSLSELEGMLVEHTLTLCNYLETQLNSCAKYHTKQRVITPRVHDMDKLRINWQHKHNQRPDSKSALSSKNKGKVVKKGQPPTSAGRKRTAGQVLILLTAKKWGNSIGDLQAGEAFHRELRMVTGKQENRKRKERSDEVSNQRFKQMQRKPWLQAKLKDEEKA